MIYRYDIKDTTRYDTIRLTILTCAQKLTRSQLNPPHGTEQKKNDEESKTKKTEMLRRNGPVVKSVESVLICYVHCVSKKRPAFTTCYNFLRTQFDCDNFGTNIAEKVSNQNVLYFPTTPH